jgi:hypothetical protein
MKIRKIIYDTNFMIRKVISQYNSNKCRHALNRQDLISRHVRLHLCDRAATVPLDVSRQRNATSAEGLCMCGVSALGGPPVLLLSCCSVIAVALTHFAVFEVRYTLVKSCE